jgi:hypothetical protein
MADLSTQQLAVFVTSQLLVGKHNPSRDELETAAERAFDLNTEGVGEGLPRPDMGSRLTAAVRPELELVRADAPHLLDERTPDVRRAPGLPEPHRGDQRHHDRGREQRRADPAAGHHRPHGQEEGD